MPSVVDSYILCCTLVSVVFCDVQAKGNKGGSVAKKASKGGNPLSGIGTNLPQAGGAPKKASKAASNLGSKASKTANKAAAKVRRPSLCQLAKFSFLFHWSICFFGGNSLPS